MKVEYDENKGSTDNGEDDLRVMENGMSVPVSGLTTDFGNQSPMVVEPG